MNVSSPSSAKLAAPRTAAASSSTSHSSTAHMATICCASTSSGLRTMRVDSIAPARIRSTTTATSSRSPRYFGKILPVLGSPTWWPARPMRWRPRLHRARRLDLDHEVDGAHVDAELEAAGGDERPQPAGLELVLDEQPLLAGERPVVGLDQLLARELVEPRREPLGEAAVVARRSAWCGGRGSARGSAGARGARCSSGPRRRAACPASPRCRAPSAPMSSMGTMTSRSSSLRTPASTTVTGRGPSAVRPPRNRAISSSGRCVAERPMRCGACLEIASSRSSDSARCAPRLVPAIAWISSTITHRTSRSVSRAPDVSIRYSDSGVVIRMSGGWRRRAVRSLAGVSPVRMPTVGRVQRLAPTFGRGPDAGDRRPEVLLHVDRERLDRREVEDPGALRLLGDRVGHEPVDRPQERGEGLARAGGGEDQGVVAGRDGGPALGLGVGGRAERGVEPLPHRGREETERVRHVAHGTPEV